jgi:type VI protein secretion system component Hcp
MSQPTKPTADQSKTQNDDKALPDAELEKVSGGKVQLHDITFTKKVDKSSPSIG